MNEFLKTGLFAAAAVVLLLASALTRPGGVEHKFFSDEGQAFFPEFTDPLQAAALEVIQFDEDSKAAVPFKVARDDKGIWTIPSHSGYPADARTRMARAANMVIGLSKDRVISDNPEDHARYGVVDPLDPSTKTEGRGVRVTLKDKTDTAIAELIVGKEVEGKMDVHYVRVPDKKRVYATKLRMDLSTKFEDWIERDLLKASSWDLSRLVFDNYTVDETRGVLVKGEKFALFKDDQQKWKLEGIGDGEETNEDKAREVADGLTQLKIVGVRKKPSFVTADLRAATGIDRVLIQRELGDRGYFFLPDGTLVSNEGDLFAETKKGIRYTLKFGEIVYGTGKAVTSGEGEGSKPEPKEGETGPPKVEGNHRYLMITAVFDESLLKKPEGPRIADDEMAKRKDARAEIERIVKAIDDWKKAHDGKLPEALTLLTEGDSPPLKELKKDPWENDYGYALDGDKFTVTSFGADKKAGGEGANADLVNDRLGAEDEFVRAASDWKAYDQKVEDGRKTADELTRRFGPWYFVIDAASFAKLKPKRKDLVKEKPAPEGGENKAGENKAGGGDAGQNESSGNETGGGAPAAKEPSGASPASAGQGGKPAEGGGAGAGDAKKGG
ncbi:MAG: DUF4340 domain-containing protein [Planctomycetota bacterium]